MSKSLSKVFLKDVADVFIGSQYTISDFKKKKCSDEVYYYVNVVSPGDLKDDILFFTDIENKIKTSTLYLRKYLINEGDILLSSKTSLLKTVYVAYPIYEKTIAIGGIIVIRAKNISSKYLQLFLSSSVGKERLSKIQKGSKKTKVFTVEDLLNLEIDVFDEATEKELTYKYSELVVCTLEKKLKKENLKFRFEGLTNGLLEGEK